MARKPPGKAAGSKAGTGSGGAADGAGAHNTTLLRLYKQCMDDNGKPKEKLVSLGAAERALQEMQAMWRAHPSRLACLLVVRRAPSQLPRPVFRR